jgi:thiamine biosynthesis protein ThiS
MSGSISIRLNGEPTTISGKSTLEDLVVGLKLAPQRIAIELNREVIKRALWDKTDLADGDIVEIVHFVGGGVQ